MPQLDSVLAQKKTLAILLDENRPVEQRSSLLISLVDSNDVSVSEPFVAELLKVLGKGSESVELDELKLKYAAALKELSEGAVRPARFIRLLENELPGPSPRAHVITPDGQERFPFLHPDVDPKTLSGGSRIFLDAKGAIVMGRAKHDDTAGLYAVFQRALPDTGCIEVLHRDERMALFASEELAQAIEAGEVTRGDAVLIQPQQRFALSVIPRDDDRRHRFVDIDRMPNVYPGRDLGAPHEILGWLLHRARIILFRDDLCRRFHGRQRASLLLTGPSGTGKTYHIKAFLTMFGDLLKERTGRSDLGSRVIRVKASEHLSKWLGETDKNYDALFDDIITLVSEEVETVSGEIIRLPVVVIIEELDGIAHRRNGGEDDGTGGVMDRIMATLLQRLDDTNDELSHLPIIFISTSNRPMIIDDAMFRRLGGRVAHFKRLDRQGFADVLRKKLADDIPIEANNGTPQDELLVDLVDQVVSYFFDAPPTVIGELELRTGDGQAKRLSAKDLLTGAIIEQAVSNAIDELIFDVDETGNEELGMTASRLIHALQQQLDIVMANVSPGNALDYLDLPERTRVHEVVFRRGTHQHVHEVIEGG